MLLTVTDRAVEAVSWNLRSLAIRLELQVPEVRIDLHWLNRQREILSSEPFEELLLENLGKDGTKAMLGILDQTEKKDSEVSVPKG